MIEYIQGDIFESNSDAIVNPVNCVGVMGAGLAKQFKERYPDNFRAYQEACRQGQVQPGRVFAFDRGPGKRPRYIFNFPTKRHWREASQMPDIQAGLGDLAAHLRQQPDINCIGLPALGCGLGGLKWVDVKREIEGVLEPVTSADVVVYLTG